jgi:hypothetical protein
MESLLQTKMVEICYEKEEDPAKHLDILQAVRWCLAA